MPSSRIRRRDVALPHILPFLGDLLGMQAGVRGASSSPEGGRPIIPFFLLIR